MLADEQHLTVIQPQDQEWRGAPAVHLNRYAQSPRELLGRRKMVGMGMSVDQVLNTQALTCSHRCVVIDQGDFRIDEHRHATLRTADQVGLAAAGAEPFEYHNAPLVISVPSC